MSRKKFEAVQRRKALKNQHIKQEVHDLNEQIKQARKEGQGWLVTKLMRKRRGIK